MYLIIYMYHNINAVWRGLGRIFGGLRIFIFGKGMFYIPGGGVYLFGVTFPFFHSPVLTITVLQSQATFLAFLSRVSHWLLIDIDLKNDHDISCDSQNWMTVERYGNPWQWFHDNIRENNTKKSYAIFYNKRKQEIMNWLKTKMTIPAELNFVYRYIRQLPYRCTAKVRRNGLFLHYIVLRKVITTDNSMKWWLPHTSTIFSQL